MNYTATTEEAYHRAMAPYYVLSYLLERNKPTTKLEVVERVCPAKKPQVYNAIKKLKKEGFVRINNSGRHYNRTCLDEVCEITPLGMDELRKFCVGLRELVEQFKLIEDKQKPL